MLDGITIATQIRYSKSELQKINGLCYLFDPSWDMNGSSRYVNNTLPMVLLYVSKFTENMQSDVSSNQMLLYSNNFTEQTVEPQLSVVADNLVNQPKEYQLECIIPFAFDSLINTPFNLVSNTYNMEAQRFASVTNKNLNYVLNKNLGNMSGQQVAQLGIQGLMNHVATTYTITNNVINIMRSLIGALTSSINLKSELLNYITGVTSEPNYNKDSFEAMWRNRSILKLKLPNTWKYRSVVIKHATFSKEGTDNKCYKATITLQEIPIMHIANNFSATMVKPNNSIYSQSMGNALKEGLVGIGKIGDNGL